MAIQPEALRGMHSRTVFDDVADEGGVAIVPVRGPLQQHRAYYWDSYEAVKERAAAAFAVRPSAVLLKISSPGGVVSGCFETAQAIRAMSEETGIPLYAYCDGITASAAYALACAAERIYAPEGATVGSVGVLMAVLDASKALEDFGMRVHYIQSGARKSDGAMGKPKSAEELGALQRRVESYATVFFNDVAASRGMQPGAVKALEAGVFTGSEGVANGLVDQVATLEEALADIAGRTGGNDDMSLKMIANQLGLKADASEAEILAALQAHGQLVTALGQRLGLPAATTHQQVLSTAVTKLEGVVPAGDLKAALERAEAAEQRLAALGAEAHEAKVDAAITKAQREGKIVPASAEHYRAMCATSEGLAAIESLFATMPSRLGDDPAGDDDPPGGGDATSLTPNQLMVAKKMGRDPKEYARFLRGEE